MAFRKSSYRSVRPAVQPMTLSWAITSRESTPPFSYPNRGTPIPTAVVRSHAWFGSSVRYRIRESGCEGVKMHWSSRRKSTPAVIAGLHHQQKRVPQKSPTQLSSHLRIQAFSANDWTQIGPLHQVSIRVYIFPSYHHWAPIFLDSSRAMIYATI